MVPLRAVVLSFLAVPTLTPIGCFSPDPNPADTSTDTDGSTASAATSEMSTRGESTTSATATSTTASTGDAPTTTSGVDGDDSTSGEALCGNGELDGDEACDDSVNDGAYGGCEPGCASSAAFCGDGEVNGPEACDDGVNANRSACSTGCVLPGSLLGEHVSERVFCTSIFSEPTRPAFRDNGNVSIVIPGLCENEPSILLEVSPTVELVKEEEYDDDVFNFQEGDLVGDNWVLASPFCNYVISGAGALTEVCENRNTGSSGLVAMDDSTYYALDAGFGQPNLAKFGARSPALGDNPEWSVSWPTDESFDDSLQVLARGPNNSAIVAGSRRTPGSGTVAYVAVYSAGGNFVIDSATTVVDYPFRELVVGADGAVVAVGNEPNRLVKFSQGLEVQWDLFILATATPSLAIDSLGNIVVLYPTDNDLTLHKIGPDSSQLWTTTVAGTSSNGRVAVDPQDQIWVASMAEVGMDEFEVSIRKYAP